MTEAEWLASKNTIAMLRVATGDAEGPHAGGVVSDRKQKLFACACCRAMRGEPLNADELDYIAHVEAAADARQIPVNPRDYPRKKLRPAVNFLQYNGLTVADYWCDPARVASLCDLSFAARASILRDIVGNPFRPVTLPVERFPSRWHGREYEVRQPWLTPLVESLAAAAYDERARDAKCQTCDGKGAYYVHNDGYLAGDVICRDCDGKGTIRITDDGTLDPNRLMVLHDALIDAGCPETEKCASCKGRGGYLAEDPGCPDYGCRPCKSTGRTPNPLLASLRSPGPKYRGLWSLDLLTNRS